MTKSGSCAYLKRIYKTTGTNRKGFQQICYTTLIQQLIAEQVKEHFQKLQLLCEISFEKCYYCKYINSFLHNAM